MRKIVLLFLLSGFGAFAQDLKEASSDKTSIMEGRLRDLKPTVEKTLENGAILSIWILKSDKDATSFIAKATVKQEIATPKEGMRTIKATFNYAQGKLSGVDYKETNVVQNPAPSVKKFEKIIAFTDNIQTSPAAGSLPEIEKFIADITSEITKIHESNVNSK
ncbi:MAG: hypothetical protein EOO50_13570 [Flavobacterium sp.]|uniref:hypothetical protein n=1 Tax=Flavobacterium sp. TaxID=239 RepID=UPI0011F66493|nr:hypothetical protein [Flavobacterium sp.]RZJ65487.1 MAG: hypothetical protein EOO50_13570 [Flavobacterium sp.]